MARLRSFLVTTLLGGLAVILPILLFAGFLRWLAGALRGLMEPLLLLLDPGLGGSEGLASLVAVLLLLGACFVAGALVRTRVGAMLHEGFDALLGRLAPGYRTVRDTVVQLLGAGSGASAMRGEVALVRLRGEGSGVLQTGIITARHADGSATVYVPTAPLPTQGFVYHVRSECVLPLPGVSFEAAMRMVLSCGAGAADLLPAGALAQDRSGAPA